MRSHELSYARLLQRWMKTMYFLNYLLTHKSKNNEVWINIKILWNLLFRKQQCSLRKWKVNGPLLDAMHHRKANIRTENTNQFSSKDLLQNLLNSRPQYWYRELTSWKVFHSIVKPAIMRYIWTSNIYFFLYVLCRWRRI